MLFEGEISEELMMLIYGFSILIIVYVMIALVLIIGQWKAKKYEEKKRKKQLRSYHDFSKHDEEPVITHASDQDKIKQNPT